MDPAAHRAAIVREGAALASVPASGLAAEVRACPGWDVAKVVRHTGRVHRWAAGHLAGDEAPSGGPRPPEGEDLLAWYRESLDLLLAELDRHDPSEPASTFAGPADVAFWFRRQAHEIAVHRWDAEDAITPGEAAPFDAVQAADAIDEWLHLFVPRFLVDKGAGTPADLVGATLHIHCTDEDRAEGAGEWLLRLTAEGCEVERAHAKGDAALRGPASDLLLAVWHRTGLADVDVVGDADRAQQVLDLIHVT
ncbi:maleylpyruvate isomerase family mycothiol-dependent enzyme [Iamia sp. SCSIO 61187]|uniref:maleylpyruvate isomerase N-terminal domain-containing protein n=1 Tax=Iamia sp. SCSIO 61187 TaxID=2722752 RepID=UPI001C62E787|nr:maleylpyruvate isomerase N-terminal domain-containing protein [Iamia sp. SCSIO 61187]QYG94962.1 maleylpyruvate isomerase family mycothiol-dependent enzyme [Iamia sp. SCSIO 61187]